MSQTLFTMSTGAPDIEAGSYKVTVVAVTPKVVPSSITGQDEDVIEWMFELEDGEQISALSSVKNTGPKSNTGKFVTALLGPEGAAVGKSFAAEDFIGKQALAQVGQNQKGWPKIEALMPLPREGRRAAPVAAPAAPTVREQAAPVAEAEADDLPF